MPNYITSGNITAVYPGDQFLLFNAEQPAPPQASQQVCLANPPNAAAVPGAAVEIQFSAPPGAFEVDVQVADTDTDAAYITIPTTGTITAVNANNYARAEFPTLKAKFLRTKLVTRTNAVNLTTKVSRTTPNEINRQWKVGGL
jgi:hypothetical protein